MMHDPTSDQIDLNLWSWALALAGFSLLVVFVVVLLFGSGVSIYSRLDLNL
jgi:hypothetical protein